MPAKLRILIAFILACNCSVSQGQITDNFTDGNFTYAPAWTGNDTDFIVNSGKQLQLNASGTGASYLKLNNTQPLDNCEWNFRVHLNFAPSTSNYARVYLVSDQPDLSAPLDGYYLQFGESLANDKVELFRQSGSISTSLCKGTTLIADPFSMRVKVTRDETGLWKLFVDSSGGTNYMLEGSGMDNTFSSTSFFGIYCEYTSANTSNFFFDDFYIYAPPDISPAKLDSVNVISENQLDIYFNESLSLASAQTLANYSVNNGIGYATGAVRDSIDARIVHLSFGTDFVSGQHHSLTITGVQDLAGNNTINATAPFYFARPLPGDIVINEVLFDPFDQGVEWVEIYNRSDKMIDLKNLFLCSRDKNGNLNEISQIAAFGHILPARSYLVLSEDPAAIQLQYSATDPKAFITMSSIPGLNNDNDKIVIADASHMVIDELHYHSSWHLPLLNDTKGFSLERVNFESATQNAGSWHTASENSGGATPGYQNSQYTDGTSVSEITVEPEVFSPDNDGYNDILSISYAFDSPGMIGNVHIYDSQGRLEKTLVRNELLAASGTFFWDGISDEKLKARMGIYVIYFECFTTSGVVKKYKKACVVGGKM